MTLLIADAGPLIAFARIEKLELLQDLYGTVIIPGKVHEELAIGSNRPGAQRLGLAISQGWLQVVAVDHRPLPAISALVDEGEAEAITLAISRSSDFPQLLIDDRRGRSVAKHHDIKIIGTAGILLTAHKRGLLPEVKPVLDQLCKAGYRLSFSLCQKIIATAAKFSG